MLYAWYDFLIPHALFLVLKERFTIFHNFRRSRLIQSVTYPDFLVEGRPFSARGLRQLRHPQYIHDKALVEPQVVKPLETLSI